MSGPTDPPTPQGDPMLRPSPRTLRRALAGTLLLAAAAAPVLAAAPAEASNAVTRATVISRAQNWMSRNVQYSQTATATGPAGKARYRTDCSGFVSMTWELTPTGLSAPNTTTLKTATYSTKIAKANLKEGDILDGPGHVVLFQKWANSAHTTFWLYEEANPTEDMNHRVASLSTYSSYTAYRYNKIK